MLKPSTTRTLASARRQKLFPTQKKAISSSLSKARLASTAQASVCDTEMSCGEDSVEAATGVMIGAVIFKRNGSLYKLVKAVVGIHSQILRIRGPLMLNRIRIRE